jgi:serine/threonine-protein kinase
LDHGDPWWEFVIIPWGKEPPAHYVTGMINEYFDNDPPQEFFDMLSYYYACDALSALCYTFTGMENGYSPDDGKRHMENILRWFDNMNNPVPTWYLKDFYIQWTDGVPYKLEAPFDFSFMAKYGKVFKAFDEQGSGNISFGVENGEKKYFVKFAGAPRPNYIANRESGAVDAASAIEFLKAAVPLYTELAHPTLIKFVSAEEIGGGYAAVFEWVDAIGIEPKDSPDYMRFMQMPVEKKMRAFEDIMEFHAHIAAKGYVALDFYDGSILYDYEKEKVVICDIDLYQKSPFVNADGLGIVGSARYVSPEECVQDAIMDEITNVYTMGATAFALFAYGNRSPEAWTLNKESYNVAKKAVNDERSERQQSIAQFIRLLRKPCKERKLML